MLYTGRRRNHCHMCSGGQRSCCCSRAKYKRELQPVMDDAIVIRIVTIYLRYFCTLAFRTWPRSTFLPLRSVFLSRPEEPSGGDKKLEAGGDP